MKMYVDVEKLLNSELVTENGISREDLEILRDLDQYENFTETPHFKVMEQAIPMDWLAIRAAMTSITSEEFEDLVDDWIFIGPDMFEPKE